LNGHAVSRCWQLTVEGWHPMRLNLAMQNWISRKQGKDDAIRMFTLAAQAAGCPAATGKRALHLRLEGFRKKPDADAYDKVVLDALKRSGLITDDDEAGLLGRMGFEAVLGKERRTILLIGDVA
jgi:Holliday junction resolvase RusA-like endonuclease